MKTQLILAGFLTLAGVANAQFSGSCPTTTGCPVGIGAGAGSYNPNVNTQLDVKQAYNVNSATFFKRYLRRCMEVQGL